MMEKALITEAEVREAISDGSFTIRVNGEPIITPLAASSIEEHGIRFYKMVYPLPAVRVKTASPALAARMNPWISAAGIPNS